LTYGMTRPGSVIDLALFADRGSSRRAARAVPADPAAPSAFDLAAEYDAHARVLFGYAVNALRDRGAAEDCVQETFLRAWKARATFDSDRAGARTWLFAILRNVIVDSQRSSQRSPRLAPADDALDVPAPERDTLERLLVSEAVAKLSDEHRAVVVAVHLNGESYSDLSARSGVAVATLRTRAFYALRALRTHIDGEEGAHD
jgi:RNA polymerase sigma-70 factor (ECF subfamily)